MERARMQSDSAASILADLIERAREAPGLAALTHLQDRATLGVEINRGHVFVFVDGSEVSTGEALATIERAEDASGE